MKQLSTIFTILFCIQVGCSEKDEQAFITGKEASAEIETIVSNIQEPHIPDLKINIIEFSGQQPDETGSVDFYSVVAAAIDTLEAQGGGWLHFPNTAPISSWMRYTETYKIEGPIHLKSNIGLILDRSVRLFFPFDPVKYLPGNKGVLTRYEGTTIYSFSPLIRAFNAENIAIVSNGRSGAMPVIDGDGEKWQRWMWNGEREREKEGLKPSYELLKDVNNSDNLVAERVYINPGRDYFRPETMEFFLCKNVLVDGIKITNSPFWCIKPVFSESCIFRNLAFDAMVANNDGVDPESSKNVLIENIRFGNHDDNVAIKSGRDKEGRDGARIQSTEIEGIQSDYIKDGRITGATENVVIRNNHFSGHHAICIGSEMSGSVRNIFAVNNTSVGEVNMGVFIKGSRLRGGIVENVYIDNLKLNHTKSELISIVPNYDKADESPYPPQFRKIQIQNVSCNSAGAGILVHGWSDEPVENVLLKNITLNTVGKDELIVKQVNNVVVDNVEISSKKFNTTISQVDNEKRPPERI
ncbi:glycosyl hydrolase family 28 protein [uncultured Draconibacterium sp.]|uniref:glycoside hydrolase family 28 protein n=1 Tax=uncultured Draconibacterium sp. TaxID=1573823 RepID=UPI0029C9A9E1|nr:glycosyl hydrolase family 28 protein [uncultured Draconibacterium sp.]